jgi:hypothetical protein
MIVIHSPEDGEKYRLLQAKELLKELGYHPLPDGTWVKDSEVLPDDPGRGS